MPLRFTWERIDELGRDGVVDRLTKAESGEPGAMRALAELVAAGTGTATADEVMADPPGFEPAFAACLTAWLLALHGPEMKPKAVDENPLNRLRTWLSTLFRRHTR